MDEIIITIRTCEDTGTLMAWWDDPAGSGGLSTQADQLSDLERNIREAVAVHFEPGELPKHLRLHFLDDHSGARAGRFHLSSGRKGPTSGCVVVQFGLPSLFMRR